MRKVCLWIALCAVVVPHPSGATVERARDYTEKGDLTKPVYKTIVHERVMLRAAGEPSISVPKEPIGPLDETDKLR